MANSGKANNVVGLRASTVALFEATFAFVIGLGIAIIRSLELTVNLTQETNSVLLGLSFGLSAGVVLVIVLPLVYFGIGWLLGYLHGWVLNAILRMSGGVVFYSEK